MTKKRSRKKDSAKATYLNVLLTKGVMDVYVVGYDLFKESLITESELQDLDKACSTILRIKKNIKGRN
jgi:hypothetical protein